MYHKGEEMEQDMGRVISLWESSVANGREATMATLRDCIADLTQKVKEASDTQDYEKASLFHELINKCDGFLKYKKIITMKSLLIAAGTGANNIIVNIGDEYEDRVDYILIDELESNVWKVEFSAERMFDVVVTRQPVILLATLGGNMGNRSVERLTKLFKSFEIPFSAILIIPFKFEGDSRNVALSIADRIKGESVSVYVFDNETLTFLDLTVKEAIRYADREIGCLLDEILK